MVAPEWQKDPTLSMSQISPKSQSNVRLGFTLTTLPLSLQILLRPRRFRYPFPHIDSCPSLPTSLQIPAKYSNLKRGEKSNRAFQARCVYYRIRAGLNLVSSEVRPDVIPEFI